MNKNLLSMRLIIKVFLLLFFTIFFLDILLSISLYKMPWYDEVFFLDVTRNLMHHNLMEIAIIWEPREILTYGPVYFFFQKIILSSLDFGMWQFRLLNLLSGLSIVLLFVKLSKKIEISRSNRVLFLLLLLTNGSYINNMTSGRMDLFAVMLFFIGFLMFKTDLFSPHKHRASKIITIVIAGFISSLAFLTTPRIGFYFLIYPIIFFIDIFSNKEESKKIFIEYFIFALLLLIPISIYVYAGFGDIISYISHYKDSESIADHFGVTAPLSKGFIFNISFCLWIISSILTFKNIKNIKNPIYITIFTIPIFHLLFIKEVGPYIPMMYPFLFMAIFIGANSIKNKIVYFFTGGLIILSLLFYSSTVVSNFAYLDITNPKQFKLYFDSKHIRGEKIIADFEFYYILNECNNDFISYYLEKNNNRLSIKDLNNNNIQYALVLKKKYEKDKDFLQSLGFILVDEFKSVESDIFVFKKMKEIARNTRQGYDAVLLQRKKTLND